jgi:hypothetical protein
VNCSLENVTGMPELWGFEDPVRPELDVAFKTSIGRGVFGLKGEDGKWKAFMCYARTSSIPRDIEDLTIYTCPDGPYIIPYTVWSYEKGAGRTIINKVLSMIKNADISAQRVVTLSPQTKMAERFHIRNKAKVFRRNSAFVNFEYELFNEG